jgi:biopolymer transport protein ExbB/TolQ
MRRIPIRSFVLLSLVLTSGFFLIGSYYYVPDRQRQIIHASEQFNKAHPNAAKEATRILQARGVPFPPDDTHSPPLSVDTLDVFGRVTAVETSAREYNRAIGEVKNDLWAPNTTKAEQDAQLLPGRTYPMLAGWFQASGLLLVVLAVLVLTWLRLDVWREERAIRRQPELTGAASGAITPEMAEVGADKLHGEFKPTKTTAVDRERHSAFSILAYKLLSRFTRFRATTGYEEIIASEVEQVATLGTARFALVFWIVFAAPTLKLLATLFFMAEGMEKAINPANLPQVVSSISEGFSATIVSLLLLIPLMLAKHLVAARVARLHVQLKDVGEEFVGRFRADAPTKARSTHPFWSPLPVSPNEADDILPPVAGPVTESEPLPRPQPVADQKAQTPPTPVRRRSLRKVIRVRSRLAKRRVRRWGNRGLILAAGIGRSTERRSKIAIRMAEQGFAWAGRIAEPPVAFAGRRSLLITRRVRKSARATAAMAVQIARLTPQWVAAALMATSNWLQWVARQLIGPFPTTN